MTRRVDVAGVPVDIFTMESALAAAKGFLDGNAGKMVVTPNPEMAVLADRNADFVKTLASADLALCDGFGLKLAALLWGKRVPEVIRGIEFAERLAELCAKEGKRLYLLGGEEDTAEVSAKKLQARFQTLNVVGVESGGSITFSDGRWVQDEGLVGRIAAASPDVLFVALGHGKQEPWIRAHLPRLPSVRIAIGIGGSFHYWAGRAKQPPKAMRQMHLEWFWRLVTEPSRAKRIFDAVILFPMLALKKRLFTVK